MASLSPMVLGLRRNVGSEEEERTAELDEFLGEMTWIMRPVFSESDRMAGSGDLPLCRAEKK
jgi:hypothetical protein